MQAIGHSSYNIYYSMRYFLLMAVLFEDEDDQQAQVMGQMYQDGENMENIVIFFLSRPLIHRFWCTLDSI